MSPLSPVAKSSGWTPSPVSPSINYHWSNDNLLMDSLHCLAFITRPVAKTCDGLEN